MAPEALVAGRVLRVIPPLILVLFAADVVIGAAALVQFEIRAHFGRSHLLSLFALGNERNFGTWYSSLQLATNGALLLVLAAALTRHAATPRTRAWLMPWIWLPGMLFLAMSADEALELHEWVANAIGVRVPQLSRDVPLFHKTGLWMVPLVPAFLAALFFIARAARPIWTGRRDVVRLYLAGFVMFLLAAAGIELLGNFTPHGRVENLVVTMEEVGELLGETLLLWATVALLRSHGLRLSFSPPPPPAPPAAE